VDELGIVTHAKKKTSRRNIHKKGCGSEKKDNLLRYLYKVFNFRKRRKRKISEQEE